MEQNIGFVGLGVMGLPMAKNLLNAGYRVAVFDVRDEPLREISKHGAKISSSILELAKASNIVICMVRTNEQVESVISGQGGVLEGLPAGSIILVMATVHPMLIQRLSEITRLKGIRMLDAPVSGAKIGAEKGALSIMIGGEKEAFVEVGSILEVLGKKLFYMGGSGMGALAKLFNQQLLLVNMNAIYEVMRFAEAKGMDSKTVCDLIKTCTGNSWVLENWDMVKSWRDRYEPGGTLDTMYKDIRMVLEIAEGDKIPLYLAALCSQLGRY